MPNVSWCPTGVVPRAAGWCMHLASLSLHAQVLGLVISSASPCPRCLFLPLAARCLCSLRATPTCCTAWAMGSWSTTGAGARWERDDTSCKGCGTQVVMDDGQLVNYRWEGRRTSLWLSNSSRSDLLLPTPPHPSWYVQRSSNPTTRHVPQAGPQRARRPKEDCVGHQAHLAARLQVGGRLAGLNCRNALQAHSQQLCWRVARLMCVTERAWLQTS